MSPLQKIAMGMVFIAGRAPFPAHPHPSWRVYDGLADPIGWLLVFAGIHTLSRTRPGFSGAWWTAVLAGAVSVPLWFPTVTHPLDDSALWALSLPQIAFCALLAKTIAEGAVVEEPGDRYIPKRFGLLMWAFVVLAILPPVALGGGVSALDDTTVVLALVVNLAFIYYLFRVHRRTWLGGPGALQIQAFGSTGSTGTENDEDRPPT